MQLWKNKFDVVRITKELRMALGSYVKFGGPNIYKSVTGITATSGGTQAAAIQLIGENNEITTCAAAGDSVLLPTASLGKRVRVKNSGAAAADIFPQTGSAIDSYSANAAYRLGPGLSVTFEGASNAAWQSSTDSSFAAGNKVTQATNVTTGVTLNAAKGVITTQSETAAAGVSATFTVNNSKVVAGSVVRAWLMGYAGTFTTNGIPIVSVNTITGGSFNITVSNGHSANALSGAATIGFEVVP